MAVLLIMNDPDKFTVLDRIFHNTNSWRPTVYLASTLRQASNYLVDTTDIDMVFMGFYLNQDKKDQTKYERDTISSGLVRDFVRAGYGVGGKPLIACTPNRNRQLLKAGCSYPTDLTLVNLQSLLKQVEYDTRFVNQMLCAG